MLGYPKVLVCDAGASGPPTSLSAEAPGHSRRGFSVRACSCVLVYVTVFLRDFGKLHKIGCNAAFGFMCVSLCMHMIVRHHGDVSVLS